MPTPREMIVYADAKPCAVCGSPVDLRPRRPAEDEGEPVGPPDGVVGGGDPTVDVRVCTNADCPTNRSGSEGQLP